MRPLLLAAPVLLAALAWPGQAVVTQPMCDGAPEPVLFAEAETSLENLAFDGKGSLYVSEVGRQVLLDFLPDGRIEREIDVPAHGVVWGPDDRLYAVVTAGETYDIQRSTDASVTDFEVYSRDVSTYNGMAFDGDGDLYVSDDSVAPPAVPPDLIRIPRDDPMAWEPWTPMYGPNGLAYDAATDSIYTVVTADQSSPVLRLSATDKAKQEVVTYLSWGMATLEPSAHAPQGEPVYPVPKGLDDLALGPDGLLYITAHLSGELLRVDPATGDACVLAAGLEEPTSVRIARGFGDHGGKLFVTTWGGVGLSGIALGQADQHPVGRIWTFDVGFVEEPETGEVLPPPGTGNTTSQTPVCIDGCGTGDPSATNKAKDSPTGPMALLALAALAFLVRRR